MNRKNQRGAVMAATLRLADVRLLTGVTLVEGRSVRNTAAPAPSWGQCRRPVWEAIPAGQVQQGETSRMSEDLEDSLQDRATR